MTRCALELIGRSGLGYSFDTLAENSVPHPFVGAIKQLLCVFQNSTTNNIIDVLRPLSLKASFLHSVLMPIALKIGTPCFRRAIVDLIPSEIIRKLRDIVVILYNTSVEILEIKKEALRGGDQALAAQIGKGKDIISILCKDLFCLLLHPAHETDDIQWGRIWRLQWKIDFQITNSWVKLRESENIWFFRQVTEPVWSFLTSAATDTVSSALSRIFHLLALHKDVQARLREEILEARKQNGGEDLSYDILVSLPYMDAICRETLRL